MTWQNKRHPKLIDCSCKLAYTCRMITMATASYQQALKHGLSQSEAWNSSTVDWTAAAIVSPSYLLNHITSPTLSHIPHIPPPPPPPPPHTHTHTHTLTSAHQPTGPLSVCCFERLPGSDPLNWSVSQQPCCYECPLCPLCHVLSGEGRWRVYDGM